MNLPLGSPHASARWQTLPAHRHLRPPLRNPKRALEGPTAPGTMCPGCLSPQPAATAAHSYGLWRHIAWQWVKSAPWCLWPQPQAQIPGKRLALPQTGSILLTHTCHWVTPARGGQHAASAGWTRRGLTLQGWPARAGQNLAGSREKQTDSQQRPPKCDLKFTSRQRSGRRGSLLRNTVA